jgi:hypothetical protein
MKLPIDFGSKQKVKKAREKYIEINEQYKKDIR